MHCDLLKKQQEHLESRCDDLQKQQQRLRDCQETNEKWEMEQQKMFMETVKAYNCEYCLLTHRHTMFHHQVHAEMVKLMQEADILSKEMHFMAQTNAHVNLKQEKKTVIQSHLTQLEIENEKLETEVEEAASQTSTLKMERTTINNKPLVDKLCLRLKDEVSMHKEENLELNHQSLSDKIQLLQKKLSQKAGKS